MNEPPMESESHYDPVDDEQETRTFYAPDGVARQVSPQDADEALRPFGLTTAVISAAIRAGYDALNAAPKTLPPWFRRSIPAGYIASSLFGHLIEHDWLPFVYGQDIGVTSADNAFGVLVWPGNDSTGVAERRAKNVRARGDDSRDLFDPPLTDVLPLPMEIGPRMLPVESSDDDVAPEDAEAAPKILPPPRPDRWIVVLRHRIKGSRRVRAEVQLVERDSLSNDGYLTRAVLRVLLADIELGKLPLANALTPAAVADLDVDVSRIDDGEDDEE